jgi:REP element-mobilizing transposase RayT
MLDDPIVNAIIQDVWLALPKWFPTVALDEFVIMPNHIHFVIWITNNPVGTPLAGVVDVKEGRGIPNPDGGEPRPYRIPEPQKINTSPVLGDVIGAFKSLVFKVYFGWIKANDPSRQAKFWQSNYYEYIIRNDKELNAIRQYIIDNPILWKKDRDNLQNMRKLSPPVKVGEYLEDLKILP